MGRMLTHLSDLLEEPCKTRPQKLTTRYARLLLGVQISLVSFGALSVQMKLVEAHLRNRSMITVSEIPLGVPNVLLIIFKNLRAKHTEGHYPIFVEDAKYSMRPEEHWQTHILLPSRKCMCLPL